MDTNLYLIVPYCNPMDWSSRLTVYRRFENHILQQSCVKLVTIELTYGDRPYMLPAREGVIRIQRRTNCVMWHKENIIAIAERHLPPHDFAGYVDGDFLFNDPHIMRRAIDILHRYPIAQVSTRLVSLGPPPAEEAVWIIPSLMSVYAGDYDKSRTNTVVGERHPVELSRDGYPGGCWVWRHYAYSEMGGMLERCIDGSADQHMAAGLLDLTLDETLIDERFSPAYRQYIKDWRRQAYSAVRGYVGMVPGTAQHLWHGRIQDRGYADRGKILMRNEYNPHLDVRANGDGVLEFTNRKPLLRSDVLSHFKGRNEDSVDEITPHWAKGS